MLRPKISQLLEGRSAGRDGHCPCASLLRGVNVMVAVSDYNGGGERWQETEFVFTTLDGRPLEGMNVTHHFQRLLAKAGVRKRRFHDLRHSCATVLMAKGVPARVAMEILGHSEIGVTMNTYTHVLDELSRDAAGQMDAYLRDLVGGDPHTATEPAS